MATNPVWAFQEKNLAVIGENRRNQCFAAKVPVISSNFAPWDPSLASYIANQIAVRARPFARFFSSAWVIVAISLAIVIILISTFAT